jgi:exodeoxyribonuclease V alpha subunit
MVDIFLFCSLLRAIRPGARLIIIGDADQLPPVGAGDAFSAVLKSGCFSSVSLTDIFRQAKGSSIVTNAHLIKDGKMPVADNSSDYFFLSRNKSAELKELIVQLCTKRLPSAYGFDSLADIQVICPTRKGEAGTVSLNIMLQSILNPPAVNKIEYKSGDVVFRKGDKVMAIRNNYDIEWTDEDGQSGCGIFNGDIGVITEIDREEQSFTILFDDGRCAILDYACFDDIEHAYAITVHKSQGSEYKSVIIPLCDCPAGLLTRNMLYTALTRAEKIAIIAGRHEIMSEMISNVRTNPRNTGLERMIKSAYKKYGTNEQ